MCYMCSKGKQKKKNNKIKGDRALWMNLSQCSSWPRDMKKWRWFAPKSLTPTASLPDSGNKVSHLCPH